MLLNDFESISNRWGTRISLGSKASLFRLQMFAARNDHAYAIKVNITL